MIHNRSDLFHALSTQKTNLGQVVVAVAVGGIDIIEIVQQGFILLFQFSGVLGYPQSGAGCIFVAGIVAGEISMAFFGTENKIIDLALSLYFIHDVANVFESYQKVANTSHTIFLSYFLHQRRGDFGFYQGALGVQATAGCVFGNDVIGQDDANFIAGQKLPVFIMLCHDTDSIGIRVGAD